MGVIGYIILAVGIIILVVSLVIPNVPGALDWYESITVGEHSVFIRPVQQFTKDLAWVFNLLVIPFLWNFVSVLFIIGVVVTVIGIWKSL